MKAQKVTAGGRVIAGYNRMHDYRWEEFIADDGTIFHEHIDSMGGRIRKPLSEWKKIADEQVP